MSFSHARWTRAISEAGLRRTERAVALTLPLYADPDGWEVRPGIVGLAEEVGASTKTIERALARLRALGLIIRTSRADRWRGLADVYRLVVPGRRSAGRSTDTRTPPPNDGTTGRGRVALPARNDDMRAALAHGWAMTAKERERVAARAERMIAAGWDEGLILRVLGAAPPDGMVSGAALLHARLITLEKGSRDDALKFLDRLLAARWWAKRTKRRRTGTAPRAAEDFGPTSEVLSAW